MNKPGNVPHHMPISPELLASIEQVCNRLAGEIVLAVPGRDDGLVPAYSLLGELRELGASIPALDAPLAAMFTELDRRLDAAQPFDEACLGRLRRLVEWIPAAIEALRAEQAVPAFAAAPATAAAVVVPAAPEAGAASDVLLELNLGENRELLVEFHAEVVDHLQQIEAALLALEHQPDEPEALNSIFRSFHTIKGNAGFLGLVPMQTLAHEVESLLDLARNHQLRLNSTIITEILRSRDALQELTQQVGAALEQGQLPARIIPVSHLIQSVKRLALGRGAAGPEEVPLPVSAPAPTPAPAAVIPLPPAESAPTANDVDRRKAEEDRRKLEEDRRKAAEDTPKAAASQTVRVNTDKLDSIMDVVGELVIVQSQLIESTRQHGDAGSPLQRNVAQLSRITKELQHTAMALRMIPIKPTFQKMERLVRDLAHDFGKKVSFVTEGEDTELDRTVVEKIGDPLVHMVRNALDHGLEPTAGRIAAGKPETGTVRLRAYHQGSNIVIELQDDGRGINPDRIYAKAVEKGVIAAGTVLTREETYALIFAPGLSTAEKVTAVSGRGVGMDVVKRNIEKLRGKIEITSVVGAGSTFKIKLPLTMAIIDGLVVRVGEDRFILPSTSVQMALRPAREHIATVHGSGEVLDLRGRLLPLHRLHRCFDIPALAQQPWEGIVVIVEHSGKASALLVDELVSKQEVVIKNLGALMQGLPGVSGGAILGDGNIALILDPGTLLSAA